MPETAARTGRAGLRVLVTGAYGLIGGYVTARLLAAGWTVTGVGRDVAAARRRFPAVRWEALDLRSATETDWRALLEGVDAVVNCAGALQDSPRDDVEAVHVRAVAGLVRACHAAGVRRFVQVSASGAERGLGAFMETKRRADADLKASSLDWVVLRPALVIAPAAYGGSALLRGLAAFPWVIPCVAPDAPLGVVAASDVAEAARLALTAEPSRFEIDLVASRPTRLRDILQGLREWLGLRPAPVLALPKGIGAIASAAADALAWLGWRSPMRSTALAQVAAGVGGRPGEAGARLGLTLKEWPEILAASPSGVQERWFARLYFAKPAVIATLAAFWAISGLIGFARAPAAACLLTAGGLPGAMAEIFVFGGSAVDLLLAALVCVRRAAPTALRGMIILTLGYLVGASLWTPWLWADPLGPLVKSVPAAMLALAGLAMMDER